MTDPIVETAVISGVASGIGRACCELFLARGHRVIGLDSNASAIMELQNKHESSGCAFRQVNLLTDQLNSWGSLNVALKPNEVLSLINCVGGSIARPFEREDAASLGDWQTFEAAFEFNIKPNILMINLCLPLMIKAQRGYIVNISSVSARLALSTVHISYPIAKSAVIGLSRQLASDLAPFNILVNTICPGVISTPRIMERWEQRTEEQNSQLLEQIPLSRLGAPEDVAELAYFVSTRKNAYITGAIFDVNGGMYLP